MTAPDSTEGRGYIVSLARRQSWQVVVFYLALCLLALTLNK